jgi:hypothetical protein
MKQVRDRFLPYLLAMTIIYNTPHPLPLPQRERGVFMDGFRDPTPL